MEYGIVYLWYDRKHKRYYVGSHWGTENDGYVCSSTWMKKAYKRRPEDFKKKILKRVYTTRKELLDEEYKWLSLIKEEELGKKYYNVRKHKFNHWSATDKEKISKTISEKTKEAMYRPDVRERYLESLKTRKNNHSAEVLEKRRKSMLGKNKGKITVKDKQGNIFHASKDDPRWISGELVGATKNTPRPKLTEEHKKKVLAALHKQIFCECCNKNYNPGNFSKHKKKYGKEILC